MVYKVPSLAVDRAGREVLGNERLRHTAARKPPTVPPTDALAVQTDLEASISQAIVNLESSNDRIIEKAVAEMRLSNEWAISKTNLNFLWLQ
eukprot:gene19530-26209_t